MLKYLALIILLYLGSYFYYIKVSHGLGRKAELLQLRRFLPCAILAVLPVALTQISPMSTLFLTSILVGISWLVTYPLLYFYTYNKSSSDFGFHLDIVFGLYFIAWSSSLKILIQYFNFFPSVTLIIISLAEIFILALVVFQYIYYSLYKTCLNDASVTLIKRTDLNETIEFFKSLPLLLQIIIPVVLLSFSVFFVMLNLVPTAIEPLTLTNLATIVAVASFSSFYLWNTRKGVFYRTGLIELILDVNNYLKQTLQYRENLQARLEKLIVKPTGEIFSAPSTIILIIGESESRDYMSAFSNYEKNTTPWLKANQTKANFVLFPNTYACADQTVPVLELALTEANQYNNIKFFEACSIIDIAKASGYKTYWFSNQGNIGSAETPITLVANTADHAAWTKQNLNEQQYDEILLEHLKTVNPKENNFIVLHLMGNHFNFINRYPQSFAKFSEPNKYDLIPNYLDSIAYTDHVLEKITNYANNNLNLQSLLYFSDHGTIPDKRRSPNFGGFATVRIPMFAYFSNEYMARQQQTYTTLKENSDCYFTNDLVYELVCGIIGVESNHFEQTNSPTSKQYKHTQDTLTTNLGKTPLYNEK